MDTLTSPMTDPLYPTNGQFPLGRPFGIMPGGTDATPAEALPFGLRLAVTAPAADIENLDRYGYDHHRQIGVVHTHSGAVPLARHTTGQTRTVAHPDGHRGPDTDQDVRED
ncbi:MAG: putative ATP-grasp-modified RiPP [Dactylosporangium sp.]|nr:putative ATP-grasp-modified RiPP [Dactylosporangium sp.]NNJ61759.1 putative ATP-grasp-modified RiPP [Dactylosporangium sp.]